MRIPFMPWAKAPSTNIQAPEKHQAPKPVRSFLKFGVWNFSGAWSLGFEAFKMRP
jgi:hypothetical protein